MSVLLPLYVYPWPGAWDPLYWIAANNVNLDFTVIINPCSGPCIGSLPEAPYLTEIPKLKNYPNIKTLGYVATNYTNKPIMDVVNEIDIYARWANLLGDAKYSVDGIFFDEIPGTYDWQSHDYLKRAAEEVNFQNGLGQQVIVHNPGQIPYPTWNYLDLANLTVVFEETYSNWLTASTFSSLKNLSSTVGYPKSAFALMLHSVPDIPAELVSWTADQMSQMADWNFVSSVKMPDAWHSFSSLFTPFMTAYGGVNR